MKRLNFSKMMAQAVNFTKSLFSSNKQKINQPDLSKESNTPTSHSTYHRKGGYKYYTHVMKSKNRTIYRNFKKSVLPGFKMIIGKELFTVKFNPYFGS